MNIMKRKVLAFLWIVFLFFGMNTSQSRAQGWDLMFEQVGGLYITDLFFIDANQSNTGWMLSTSSIFQTADGGATWTEYSNGLETGCNSVCFVDENIGYVSNGYGKIFKSTDGGQNWATIYDWSGNHLGEIAFKDAMNGVCAGNDLIYTNDGGTTWHYSQNSYTTNNLCYTGGDTYFATDGYSMKVLKSTDNGVSFTEVHEASEYINTCAFADENHGLVGGVNQVLNITANGGQTWAPKVLGDAEDDLFSSAYYDADTVYVAGGPEIFKSTNGGTTWYVDAEIPGEHQSMFITKTNAVYVSSIINFSIMQIWKKQGNMPLVADFVADEPDNCGSTGIQFTDLSYYNPTSWLWSFEGGEPSTSTEQNPTVSYSTPGLYNVSLTVWRDGHSTSITKTNYIGIYELPEAPATPGGDADICSGFNFDYSVPFDENVQSYTWELIPASAGNLLVDMNEATLEADNTWTGDFTLKVKASNVCGESPWSGNFEGTLHANPTAYLITGGGSFCENSPGVEIGLSMSELGINYTVFRDGTAIGDYPGTGSPMSFGLVNIAGYYEVLGSSEYCSVYMQNQMEVTEINTPGQAGAPSGPQNVCMEVSSEYISTGAAYADSYIWALEPAEAGTIDPSGTEATISWNAAFSGTAILSLTGLNDCGEGEVSAPFLIYVNYLPAPLINGLNLVCNLETDNYSVAENEGNTYNWEVSGGEVIAGQGTSEVMVTWGTPGTGNILVTETNESGCVGVSENFVVTIDECTGIGEAGAQNGVKLFPNPVGDKLNVTVASTADVFVYSINGKLLLKKKDISGTCQLDVSSLENGAYIVKVVSDGQAISSKINILR